MKNRKGFTPYINFDSLREIKVFFRKPSRSCITGFTFIEILIVLGVIAILATAVVVTVNPTRRFEDARDKQREIHLQTILNAVERKMTIEAGWDCGLSLGPLPQKTLGEVEGELIPDFKIIGTAEGKSNPEDYYNLFSCLVPKYMVNPLYDPAEGNEADTKYQIWQNPQTKYITLRYVKDDPFKEIVAGAKKYFVLRPPTVITKDVIDENISHTWALVEGEVTYEGGASVWERGVLWTKNNGDLTFNTMDGYTTAGSATGSFSGKVTGLTPESKYYVRAYARNDIGVGYGDIKNFDTSDPRPTVRTLEATDVVTTRATLRGELTGLGGGSAAQIYFMWAKKGDNFSSTKKVWVSQEGEFSNVIFDLDFNPDIPVWYVFKACASNIKYGERCGAEREFKTEPGAPIVITILDQKSITDTYAKAGGDVQDTGGTTVKKWGICYAEGMSPTYDDSCPKSEEPYEEPFAFEMPMSPLEAGIEYWVFAYAVNEIDDVEYVGFGQTEKFTTRAVAPRIETIIGAVDQYSAELGGRIKSDGGAPIENYGVCWADIGTTPALPANCLLEEGGEVGVFNYKLKNFLANHTYNVRAFAKNEVGIRYSPEDPIPNFTTLSPALVPALGVTELIKKEGSTADFQGKIQNHGGAEIKDYGFCWSSVEDEPKPPDPVGGSCKNLGPIDISVSEAETNFNFSAHVDGLSRSTHYYVLAFAKNDQGYGFGYPADDFTTDPPDPATVETTCPPSRIEGRKAWAGGELTYDGGDPETIAGICYSPWPLIPKFPPLGDVKCTRDWQWGDDSVFISEMTNLVGGSNYYYRAYAQNNHPTKPVVYGDEICIFEAGSGLGESCTLNEECRNKKCVDGVCCENACLGNCYTCNLVGNEGKCTLATAGTDPRNKCAVEEDWTSCVVGKRCQRGKQDGFCDGEGNCRLAIGDIRSGYVCTGAGNETPIEDAVINNLTWCEINNTCEEGKCLGSRYYTSCDGIGECRWMYDINDAYEEIVHANPKRTLEKDTCEPDGYTACGGPIISGCSGLCFKSQNWLGCDGTPDGVCDKVMKTESLDTKQNYICTTVEGKLVEIPATCGNCQWCQGGICTTKFYDERDETTYKTVQIGGQCWMAQGLNVGTMIAGTDQGVSCTSIQKYCYGDSEANCISNNPNYPDGGLYQWNQAMCGSALEGSHLEGSQGICLTGWHIPTNDEWGTLVSYVGNSGSALQSGGASGFEGNLAGHRSTDGGFAGRLGYVGFWSSTQYTTQSDEIAWYRSLYKNDNNVYQLIFNKTGGFSVRCIKD